MSILGAGTSGLAAARLAASRGAIVEVFDSVDSEGSDFLQRKFSKYKIPLMTGESVMDVKSHFDYLVVSPGIAVDRKIVEVFLKCSDELMGEIEFAWRLSGQTPVIGITGTNGKTTTTSLVSAILNDNGIKTVSCGNYGYAYSDVVRLHNDIDVMTVELSSFQLETISTFHPTVSVWMNFAPDHMDRYRSIDEYKKAKERIFMNQTDRDWCVLKREEERTLPAKKITFSAYTSDADIFYNDGLIVDQKGRALFDFRKSGMNGRHNAENMMAAMAATNCVGVKFQCMNASLLKFEPPAHRCEIVAVVNGITYVNDSKATNLHALQSSLLGQESSVVLIAGGKEKGLDYSALNEVIAERVMEVICIGETAEKIENAWGTIVPCHRVNDLENAVKLSCSLVSGKGTVLFSPGTSSFDMFSNYEARGSAFREAVTKISQAGDLDEFS